MWKCLRNAVTNEKNPKYGAFRLSNINADLTGYLADFSAGFGGFFYFIGTVLFNKVVTDKDQIVATWIFIIGGIFFTLAGIAI
jgi:hypothetical protein